MNIPLDANILTRMAQPGRAHRLLATDAVNALVLRGDSPCLFRLLESRRWFRRPWLRRPVPL